MAKQAKKKELVQIYGGPKPKNWPLAHNHVAHTGKTAHGERGFRRFWIPPQWVGHGWSKCPCGWHNGDPHYAGTEHVKRWRERIKKHGGLEGAYREVNRGLAAMYAAEAKKAKRFYATHRRLRRPTADGRWWAPKKKGRATTPAQS